MSRPPPRLRLHARGQWFVRWGGRDWWLGTDRDAAQRAFLDPDGAHPGALVHWSAWKSRQVSRRVRASRRTIAELVADFLDSYLDEGRETTARYYQKHLGRFLHALGRFRPEELDLGAIAAFKAGLIQSGFAPKTIAHDLGAIKTFWSWANEIEQIPLLNLRARAFRGPPLHAPHPVALTLEQVRAWLVRSRAVDARLEPWLALQYLCALRVSEVPRLVRREGSFISVPTDGGSAPRGAFVLDRSKTEHRTKFPRYVMLTEEALVWLDSAVPAWSAYQSYSSLVRVGIGLGPPKWLRSTAATHLQAAGADRAAWRAVLGHAPTDAGAHYAPADLRILRATAALLTLR